MAGSVGTLRMVRREGVGGGVVQRKRCDPVVLWVLGECLSRPRGMKKENPVKRWGVDRARTKGALNMSSISANAFESQSSPTVTPFAPKGTSKFYAIHLMQNQILAANCSATEKLVLLTMSTHVKPDGRGIRLATATMGRESGLHQRTVRKALTALIQRGLVIPETRRARGIRGVVHYRFGPALQPVPKRHPGPFQMAPRSISTPLKRHHGPTNSEEMNSVERTDDDARPPITSPPLKAKTTTTENTPEQKTGRYHFTCAEEGCGQPDSLPFIPDDPAKLRYCRAHFKRDRHVDTVPGVEQTKANSRKRWDIGDRAAADAAAAECFARVRQHQRMRAGATA